MPNNCAMVFVCVCVCCVCYLVWFVRLMLCTYNDAVWSLLPIHFNEKTLCRRFNQTKPNQTKNEPSVYTSQYICCAFPFSLHENRLLSVANERNSSCICLFRAQWTWTHLQRNMRFLQQQQQQKLLVPFYSLQMNTTYFTSKWKYTHRDTHILLYRRNILLALSDNRREFSWAMRNALVLFMWILQSTF